MAIPKVRARLPKRHTARKLFSFSRCVATSAQCAQCTFSNVASTCSLRLKRVHIECGCQQELHRYMSTFICVYIEVIVREIVAIIYSVIESYGFEQTAMQFIENAPLIVIAFDG